MKEKKTHGIQLLIRAVVTDPDGKVVSDTGQKPARSFLIQFLEFIFAMFDGAWKYATATNGGEDPIGSDGFSVNRQLRIDGQINESWKGIVVGTGDTAETNEDYTLETQLTEGVGAGNITHGVQNIGSAAVVGPNVDIELKRAFTNNTGSTITVEETGVYVTINGDYHCIIRDTLTAPVPAMYSLTIYYTIRTTV